MGECTGCPRGTERCAHLGDDWVRLVYEGGKDAWGVFWSWPEHVTDVGFYYGTEDSALITFGERESELRNPADRFPALAAMKE